MECAYCGSKPVASEWQPFCSERCKLADLGRWLAGDYRVPGAPVPTDDDEGGAAPRPSDD